jgi:hypothetical protein
MARIVVLVLVAMNLLYWSWAAWIKEEEPHLLAPTVATAGTSSAQSVAAPAPCTTIGPFEDEVSSMEVEQLLRDMQLTPSRRSITQDVHEGWWVYLDNADAPAQARALRTILAAGLRDAFALPDDPTFKVSVGIFKEEAGARSRADAVRSLGLAPVVSERTRPQTLLWFEMPGKDAGAVDMARLTSEGVDTTTLQVRECLPVEQEPAL